jgi:hypothetical protein
VRFTGWCGIQIKSYIGKFTMTDHMEKITGAKAALEALTALEAMGNATNNPRLTWRQYYESIQDASNFLVRASRVEDPFLTGFISVVSEYVMSIGTGNVCNITDGDGAWEPIAAMTAGELEATRQSLEDAMND